MTERCFPFAEARTLVLQKPVHCEWLKLASCPEVVVIFFSWSLSATSQFSCLHNSFSLSLVGGIQFSLFFLQILYNMKQTKNNNKESTASVLNKWKKRKKLSVLHLARWHLLPEGLHLAALFDVNFGSSMICISPLGGFPLGLKLRFFSFLPFSPFLPSILALPVQTAVSSLSASNPPLGFAVSQD